MLLCPELRSILPIAGMLLTLPMVSVIGSLRALIQPPSSVALRNINKHLNRV